MNWPPEFTTIP
jgi:hypothetical protein